MATKKLSIRKYPDPVLREKAQKIKFPLDEKTKELILNMFETLHSSNNGVGLAAPQVGKSIKLCIIELEGEKFVIINPKITAKSSKKILSDEGCLSFPGEFYPVSRYQEIQIRFSDENGKPRKVKARDFLARAFQHEIDHLEGILFVDKIKKAKQKALQTEDNKK